MIRFRLVYGRRPRRGMAMIVTMWVVVAITGLVLTLSQTMRIEALAAANRLSQVQADAAERGVEQLLISMVDAEMDTPGSTEEVSLEAREVGDCLAWVIKPDAVADDALVYGLDDEGGKIDLNSASSDMLLRLPGMTQDLVDAIVDWRDVDSAPTGMGAEDDYYLSLPDPYHCKNGPLETPEELLLVKGFTPEVLFGYDRNRNGILDGREMQTNMAADFGSATGTGRGIYPFITVWGIRAAASSASSSGQRVADVNARDTSLLRSVLQQSLSASRADAITGSLRQLQPFSSVFDFYYRASLTPDEFSTIYTQIQALPPSTSSSTTAPATRPKVAKLNLNTASEGAMLALPGLDESDTSAIIAHRTSNTDDPANLAWLVSTLSREKLLAIGSLITGASRVYSGEIVTLSPDGRAFRRCRVVISGETTPARIIYRRDLTASGWPLDPAIRAQVRAGEPYGKPLQTSSNGGSAL